MSFYLDRLEALRRQHRMMEEAAAVWYAPSPPRARPCYPYRYGSLLLPPRPQHHAVRPPLHGGEGGVGKARGGGAPGTWPGASAARLEAAPASAGAAGGALASASGAGWFCGGCGREMSGSVAPAGWLCDGCAQEMPGSVAPAPARKEEAGGVGADEVRNKRCSMEPATQALCSPPPKRRATSALRRFPPGCGRDAAAPPLPVPVAGHDGSLSVHAPRDGGSGVPQGSGPPPPPATPLAGRKDGVLFEAAASPSAAAGGDGGSTAGNMVSASDGAACATPDGAHHCPRPALVKPSEIPGKISVPAANGPWNTYDTGSHGIAGTASDDQSLLPRASIVSARRRFPPGCGRRGSPLFTDGGRDKTWPPPSEVVRSDRHGMEVVAPLCSGNADGAAKKDKSEEEEEVASEAQESPIAILHGDATATCRHGASAAGIGAMGVCASHTTSSEEMIGYTSQCEENKAAGSSCNVLAESLAQGLPEEHVKGDTVSKCATTNTASSGAAAIVSFEGSMMRKVMFTPRKSVKPPKSFQKPALNTQCRPLSKETEEETDQLGRHTANGIEDKNEVTTDQGMQDPMSADKCSWTKGKEVATVSHYFGPKKVNVKVQLDKKGDSIMEDILSKVAVDQGNFEHVAQNADARSRVKMICSKFESICRAIVQAVDQRSLKVRRIDLAADKLIRKLPGFTKLGPIVGDVPGVVVGDQFLYRVELALVGLHRPFQGGIDTTKDEDGVLIAISVVASGGYPDELSWPGELVYTGSGKAGCGDQKLEHGNLALKNCIERKVPVRVIHGFKDKLAWKPNESAMRTEHQ
nr:unnamed protein product [Digitaria exilis]